MGFSFSTLNVIARKFATVSFKKKTAWPLHMTLQQLVFLGGPTTSPVPAENLRTSIDAGPDSGLLVWSSPPLRLFPVLLLLLLPVLSRLLLLLRCLSAEFRFLLFADCSTSSGDCELCCWWTARDIDRCFLRSDRVWETVVCCCCELLRSCCGLFWLVWLLVLRTAPWDEALGEKELLDTLTFSDEVGETEKSSMCILKI